MIVNALACIVGSFFFGYKAIQYTLNKPDVNLVILHKFAHNFLKPYSKDDILKANDWRICGCIDCGVCRDLFPLQAPHRNGLVGKREKTQDACAIATGAAKVQGRQKKRLKNAFFFYLKFLLFIYFFFKCFK